MHTMDRSTAQSAHGIAVPEPAVRLGGRTISWFHLCGLAGGLAWLAVVLLGARIRGLPSAPVPMLAGVAVGTFLLLAIGTALVVGEGRLVWFHHQLGIIAASAAALAVAGLPVLDYLDLVGAALLAFGIFGRVGCLLVGCCHGRPARHGVVYGPAHVEAGLGRQYAGVVLVPVQLLEALVLAVLLAGALTALAVGPTGGSVALSLAGYAVARFGLDRLRAETPRGRTGLSQAQWTAVAVVAAITGLSLTLSW